MVVIAVLVPVCWQIKFVSSGSSGNRLGAKRWRSPKRPQSFDAGSFTFIEVFVMWTAASGIARRVFVLFSQSSHINGEVHAKQQVLTAWLASQGSELG